MKTTSINSSSLGWASWMNYSKAEMETKGMTIRKAAQKAGISCTLGLEHVWLDGVKTKYGHVREIIGTKLLTK